VAPLYLQLWPALPHPDLRFDPGMISTICRNTSGIL
jgi:hypothetical protein